MIKAYHYKGSIFTIKFNPDELPNGEQGYFLIDSELEQLKREYFEAAREEDAMQNRFGSYDLKYLDVEDYEASKKDSHE